MKYYNMLDAERVRIEDSIKKKEEFIKSAPQGKLRCYKNGNNTRWYVITESKEKDGRSIKRRKYLSKSELDIASVLAKKGLYEKEILDEKQELRSIKMYLNNCSKYERASNYLKFNEEYSILIGENYKKNRQLSSKYVKQWLDNRYKGPVPREWELTVPTRAGFNVRSKSERDIIRVLMDYEIPFKYEEKIIIEGRDLFPDFTILSPTTGKELLWEHNGLMDKEGYADKKLKDELLYYKLGYRRGKNMIVTYEENNEGIDEVWVERIIRHYILLNE
ncbi:MAG: hypothetical protein KBS56_01805 [Clostridiales bacterium]|nr:hypothetical protein [Candidatus Crickella equi]